MLAHERFREFKRITSAVRGGLLGGSGAVGRLPRLHHVTVEIQPDQLPACLNFYRDILGLDCVSSPTAKSVWFEQGVHLYWGPLPQGATRIPYTKPRKEGPHFALIVGGRYEEAKEGCKKLGLFYAGGTPYWGSPRCMVFDPANNLIELMKFAP